MAKMLGYKNVVAGNQGTPIKPVYELTPSQSTIKDAVQHAEQTLARAEALAASANKIVTGLRADCTHLVFKDEPGFPYDNRYCVICGHPMGQV